MTKPVLDYDPKHGNRFVFGNRFFLKCFIALSILTTLVCSCVLWIYVDSYYLSPTDARISSLKSKLATLRQEIEYFKLQHHSHPPSQSAMVQVLLDRTNANDTSTTATTGSLGPYVQQWPANPFNGNTAVSTTPGKGVGWVYTATGTHYEIYATDTTGTKLLTY